MSTYVIKLGGSMVSKSEDVLIDFEYLKNFRKAVEKFISEDNKLFVVLGGGYMMRKLRDMAKQAGVKKDMDLHWIGTTWNNVNAEIVRAYMADICNARIFAYEDFYDDEKIVFENPIIVGGGGRAGHSGDVDALLIAKRLKADKVISLKNIDAVYTADPKKDPNATKIDELTWDEYFKVIGYKQEHEPGGNYPIDPIASKDAKEAGVSFIVIGGDDLENFEKVLDGEEFVGSVIKD